jgi:hypothetical protein
MWDLSPANFGGYSFCALLGERSRGGGRHATPRDKAAEAQRVSALVVLGHELADAINVDAPR